MTLPYCLAASACLPFASSAYLPFSSRAARTVATASNTDLLLCAVYPEALSIPLELKWGRRLFLKKLSLSAEG